MRILVLDSIHGGKVIADHLSAHGHSCDLVDVYRQADGISPDRARTRSYDLISAPLHLDPDYPLFRDLCTPVISHHATVRWLLGSVHAEPVIEITGKQGKSTTAAALASIMPGPGLLHTSAGLVRYPSGEVLGRYSITPASLLPVSNECMKNEWLIAEVSLGFCGIGSLGILTSFLDYPVAGGKRSALAIKTEQGHLMNQVLIPDGGSLRHDGCVQISDLVTVSGTRASYRYGGISGSFINPLLHLPGYKTPLMLAAGAALLLGIDPVGLAEFSALPGRMEVHFEDGSVIVDNANRGTCYQTTCDAYRYGREIAGEGPVTLIIGQECASVCENFPTEEIISAISEISPAHVILIPGDGRIMTDEIIRYCAQNGISCMLCDSCENGQSLAKTLHTPLILVSVKRWK